MCGMTILRNSPFGISKFFFDAQAYSSRNDFELVVTNLLDDRGFNIQTHWLEGMDNGGASWGNIELKMDSAEVNQNEGHEDGLIRV